MFRLDTPFAKFIAYLLIAVLSYGNTLVYADVVSQTGRQGQIFGQELLSDWQANQATLSGNELTLPGLSESISVQDLFPGTSSSNSDSSVRYFPDSYQKESGNYATIFDSGSAQDNQGSAAQAVLWDDATSADPSIQGQVYKILLDMTNRDRPDMRNDPILNSTRNTMNNIDAVVQEFGDCRTETRFQRTANEAHVPIYETCERIVDRSMKCDLRHDLEISLLRHHSGPLNLDSCGEGCLEMWIGQVGDNYWKGHCVIYEEETAVFVDNPDAIISATLEYLEWDDHIQVFVGPKGSETKIYNGPTGLFPPETEGVCELNTSWKEAVNIDVTPYFKNVAPGTPVNFKIRVSVDDEGEGFGRIKIRYDKNKVVKEDSYHAPDCWQAAQGVGDNFANGSVTCIDDLREPGQECAFINGVEVCESMLQPFPVDGVTSLCRRYDVDAVYEFWKGQMDCWVDVNGNTQCPYNEGENKDTCIDYENNPACGFISEKCVENARGKSGTCYVFEEVYDCGYDTEYGTLSRETELVCEGPIRCMGLDCIDVNRTQSTQFGKAAALLNAAQMMAGDLACTGADEGGGVHGDENVICEVFPGEAGECKKAMGGIVNCCEKPSGISLADYLSLIMAAPKLDEALLWLADEGWSMGSSYAAIREGVVEGFTEIAKPFSGAFDSISGAYDTAKESVMEVIDGIANKMESMFQTAFEGVGFGGGTGEAAGAAVTEAADAGAEMATEGFMAQAGSIINFISTVYTIYSVTMLAIKMIFKCTQDELMLNVNRTLHNCTYVGSYCKTKVLGACIEKRESYCCFSSPLSRIVQEQARPQLGRDFGSAENPECSGFGVNEIGLIDWERIDLSEWLALLSSNGLWIGDKQIDIPHLTGAGTTLDLGARVDAETRTMERLRDSDVDQVRIDVSREYTPYTGSPLGAD